MLLQIRLTYPLRPLILFKASTQVLNEPCPGKTTLSLALILFNSEVTSTF